MKAKLISMIAAISIIVLVAFLLPHPPSGGSGNKPSGSWKVAIAYPDEGRVPGSIALSSYSITICLSFFSEGKLNETSLVVGKIGEVRNANATVVIRLSNETSVRVFLSNSTVLVQGKDEDGLFAATDRLLLEIAGDYALDLDSSGKYLRVVHPSRGHQVGLPWLGGFTVQQVKRVPVYVHGGQADLRTLLLGPLSPSS